MFEDHIGDSAVGHVMRAQGDDFVIGLRDRLERLLDVVLDPLGRVINGFLGEDARLGITSMRARWSTKVSARPIATTMLMAMTLPSSMPSVTR